GAEWALETLPALLGADDDVSGFSVRHEVLAEAVRRNPGLRIGRTGRVMEALVPAVLEQKVVGREAWRAWRWLLTRYGEPAPGPAPEGMRVVPETAVWRQIPSWHWHRAGAEAVRARTIANAAWHAAKLEAAATTEELDRLLRALPGIGVWTSAEVRQRALGDPDAVSVGDFHLAKLVGYALTGEKTDDQGMMRLLEPYEGHRHRAAMLVWLTGLRPPARGPRMPVRDYRAF
ncbi:DNA-3-methyladenine glycosylase 2 family protein, partial [Nonomuraea deserti]